MRIATSRFGTIERADEDVIVFPSGLFGFEQDRRWLLLGDERHGALFWLQSVDHPQISLAVVSPAEFVADYRLRLSKFHWEPLQADDHRRVVVLTVLGCHPSRVSLNLRNPILINPDARLGRQVVTRDEESTQFVLACQPASLKKSA
jgi:flagellar assembly factor FliW